MYALVEVVPGLPIVAKDFLGDVSAQKVAGLVQERLILLRQFDSREVHDQFRPSRAATISAMYFALTPGSPPASAHPRARTRYAVAAASADTPRPPWTCTATVAAFDASSAMNTNADGANSGRSSGSLSTNHAARRARLRPPCTAIAMLANGCEIPCNVEIGTPRV